jgi:hypothetical protein
MGADPAVIWRLQQNGQTARQRLTNQIGTAGQPEGRTRRAALSPVNLLRVKASR